MNRITSTALSLVLATTLATDAVAGPRPALLAALEEEGASDVRQMTPAEAKKARGKLGPAAVPILAAGIIGGSVGAVHYAGRYNATTARGQWTAKGFAREAGKGFRDGALFGVGAAVVAVYVPATAVAIKVGMMAKTVYGVYSAGRTVQSCRRR